MSGYSETALVRSMSFLAESQAAVSNNIANATTFGYKRRVPITAQAASNFQSMLGKEMPSVYFKEQLDFKSGIQRPTSDPMHIALDDRPNPDATPAERAFEQDRSTFIKVESPVSKRTYLSRGGQLRTDRDGFLAAGDNYVLNSTGQKIKVGKAHSIKIEPSGLISGRLNDGGANAPLTELGQIGLYRAAKSDLRPVGNSVYAINENRPLTPATHAQVNQGFLEQSNVSPIDELVRMITVQRSFTGTQKALSSVSRIQESFISSVSR